MIFYANKISNFAAKVRLVLALKGLVFEELAPPGGYGSAAYKRIVPMGTIPALVDGDLVLSESETIAEYLEERFPAPALLPAGLKERARARFLARFHDLYLEPPLRALFAHVAPATRDVAHVRAQVDLIARRLRELEAFADPVGPYLIGPLTLADCGFPGTLELAFAMLAPLEATPPLGPRLSAWRENMLAHAVAGELTRAYRVTAEDWVAEKLSS